MTIQLKQPLTPALSPLDGERETFCALSCGSLTHAAQGHNPIVTRTLLSAPLCLRRTARTRVSALRGPAQSSSQKCRLFQPKIPAMPAFAAEENDSLFPSDGERARVRGRGNCMDTAEVRPGNHFHHAGVSVTKVVSFLWLAA